MSRVSIYVAALTGSVVALALVSQATDLGGRFVAFALVLLPVVFFLGAVTIVRLWQVNREDAVWVQGINRIRNAYLDLAPELEPYFVTSKHDDLRDRAVRVDGMGTTYDRTIRAQPRGPVPESWRDRLSAGRRDYPQGMATRAVSAPLAKLPNALTVLRLALIPVFVGLMLADDPANWPAGLVFGAAGVTDQVDGFLARRWHVESQFGKVADPLADRLMIDAAAVMLWVTGRLPWYAAVVILARDLIMVAGYKLVVDRGYDFEVTRVGKLATWVLYAALAFVLVTNDGVDWPLWLFWLGVGLALVAAAQYVTKARREVRT